MWPPQKKKKFSSFGYFSIRFQWIKLDSYWIGLRMWTLNALHQHMSISQVRSHSFSSIFFSSVDYAWLDSVHGFMAPNTVRDSKLSNEKENHLWEKEETFLLQVFLSLATCISCNSNLKHTRFLSTYIVSLPFLSLFTADNVHFLFLYGRNDEI